MTREYKSAYKIAKLLLPVLIIAFYFGRVVSGTLAEVLMILAFLFLVIFTVRVWLFFVTRD